MEYKFKKIKICAANSNYGAKTWGDKLKFPKNYQCMLIYGIKTNFI